MQQQAQKNFTEFVEARGFSIAGLARRTGISYARLIRTISETGDPTLSEAAALISALGCTNDELLAVLLETARRPGERDARGLKKTSGGQCNGTDAGAGIRSAGDSEVSPIVGTSGQVAEADRGGVRAADAAGTRESV